MTLEANRDNLSFKSKLDVIHRQTFASSMKRFLFSIIVLSTFSATLAMKFKPPTAAERIRAIGPTEGLPETLKKALEPGTDFQPIPIPKSGDWLAEHPETGNGIRFAA